MNMNQAIAAAMILPIDDMAVIVSFAKGVTMPEEKQHDYFAKGGYEKEKEDYKQTLKKMIGEEANDLLSVIHEMAKSTEDEDEELEEETDEETE